MSAETDILAPFQPALEELEAARTHTDQFGKHSSRGNQPEDTLSSGNYDDAKRAEAGVVDGLVSEINNTRESVFTEPQKAIAIKVLAHQRRTPLDQSRALITDGFSAFKRIEQNIEKSRGLVAKIGEHGISLFISHGAEDIVLSPIDYEPGHQAISLRVGGKSIAFQPPSLKSFPDTTPTDATDTTSILSGGSGDRVAEMMGQLDPESPKYRLPFTLLATEGSMNELINTFIEQQSRGTEVDKDTARYAARLLAVSMGVQHWVKVDAPSNNLKDTFIDRFASIYANLLLGNAPADTVVRTSLDGASLNNVRSRGQSLAHLGATTRAQRFYAADVSPSDIEAATREKLEQFEQSDIAASIVHSIRAKPIIDAFFEQISSD